MKLNNKQKLFLTDISKILHKNFINLDTIEGKNELEHLESIKYFETLYQDANRYLADIKHINNPYKII